MTYKNLSAPSKRIPLFMGIQTPPRLFFTISNGKHAQSIKIVEALARIHHENPTTVIPLCRTFDDWNLIPRDIPSNSVLIFDEHLGKRCFSGLCWRMNRRRKQFIPFQGIDVLWGFAVNARLDASRVASAVNQLKADFETNFLQNLDKGHFPWGTPPTPRVKKERKPKKQRRHEEFFYSSCGW